MERTKKADFLKDLPFCYYYSLDNLPSILDFRGLEFSSGLLIFWFWN
jgi:hypothetical protein